MSLDYRFRVDDSHLLVASKDSENEKIDLLLNDGLRNKGNLANQNFRGNNEFDKNSTRTFGEYLKKFFKSKFDTRITILTDIAITYDRLSDHFTGQLKDNYERLLVLYNELSNKCLMETHKKKFSSLLVI